jgi:two-component system, cell cycle sensor histidine kinase and response regulator CckA
MDVPSPGVSTEGSGGPTRVLLVEDEPVVQELIREILDDAEVLAVAGLREARAALAAGSAGPGGEIDVALVDKNLPDGTGLALVDEIKRRHPGCEVILITAYPSLESAVQALEVGVFDYLTKPFRDPQEILIKVRNAASKARLARDRERLMSRLGESEERYRRLFEASSEAVLVIDAASNRVAAANQAAVELYGWPTELVGVDVEELRAPDSGEDWPMGDRLRLVSRLDRRGDGSGIAVEVSTARVTLGGRACLVEVIRDVTERRRLESELKEAQKMESLGRLAGGIAHDLNNILVVLINCSGFLHEFVEAAPASPDREVAQQDVSAIAQATEGAQRLARQLLAFGRRHRIAPEVLDGNDVVRETVTLLRRVLEENISLDVRLDPAAPLVEIDRGQLEQVLINLAVNARDAMPGGGGISIATAVSSVGGLRITVDDTGVGIPDEIRERIFDPFFTTKSPERGTGLGLATVQRVVKESGGSIELASRVGQGTRFTIELPRSSGRLAARRAESDQVRLGRGEHVLLVEDDAQVRGAVGRLLRRAGYGVRDAATAAQAMDRAREGEIDLLLTDVVLPDRNSGELVDLLRQLRGPLPVIYMSGYSPSLELGKGEAFLPKPFAPERLLETVQEVLVARRALDRTV